MFNIEDLKVLLFIQASRSWSTTPSPLNYFYRLDKVGAYLQTVTSMCWMLNDWIPQKKKEKKKRILAMSTCGTYLQSSAHWFYSERSPCHWTCLLCFFFACELGLKPSLHFKGYHNTSSLPSIDCDFRSTLKAVFLPLCEFRSKHLGVSISQLEIHVNLCKYLL